MAEDVDFGIIVAVDGGDAKGQVEAVSRALLGAETAAKSLSTAGQSALDLLADRTRRANVSADLFLKAQENLARGSVVALERAFGGVATAIERESRMLEQIRGPMRRHMEDVRALNMLLGRGAITRKEYDDAVASSGRGAGIGRAASAPAAGGAPAAPAAPGGPDWLSKGPFANLPGFLKMGGQAQQTAAGLAAGAGLAAAKFGVMGSALGKAVQGLQAFALGGPIGLGIFAITELLGGTEIKVTDLGESVSKSFQKSYNEVEKLAGSLDNLGWNTGEIRSVLAGLLADEESRVRVVKSAIDATEKYRDAVLGMAKALGDGSISDVSGFVAQRREMIALGRERDRLAEKVTATTPLTKEEAAALADLNATINANARAFADATGSQSIAIAGVAAFKGSIEAQTDAQDVLAISMHRLDIMQKGYGQGTEATAATIARARAEVDALTAATLDGGPKIYFELTTAQRGAAELEEALRDAIEQARMENNLDGMSQLQKRLEDVTKSARALALPTGATLYADLKQSRDEAKRLRDNLAAAMAIAKADGDMDAVARLKKELLEANAAATSAAGGGGISKFGEYLKGLTEPTNILAREQGFLDRAWQSGKLSAKVYTDELVRQTEAASRLRGNTEAQTEALVRQAKVRALGVTGGLYRDEATAAGPRSTGGDDIVRGGVGGVTPADWGSGLAPDAAGIGMGAQIAEQQAAAMRKAQGAAQDLAAAIAAGRTSGGSSMAIAEALAAAENRAVTFGERLSASMVDAIRPIVDVGGAISSALSTTFAGLEENLVALVSGTKTNFADLGRSIAAEVARIMIRMAMLKAIQGIGALGGGVVGGTGFFDQLAGLTGFARGGSFTVGGSGGTDTTPVAFMATRNERVTIETPEQERRARREELRRSSTRDAGGATIVNQYDPNGMVNVMGSGRGQRVTANTFAANPRMYRRLLRT